jgi:hypothetical protein
MYLKIFAVDNIIKTNIFGFKDNTFYCDIHRHVSNGHGCDKFWAMKIDNRCTHLPAFIRFARSNIAHTLLVICIVQSSE